jgi:hypothetical protein
LPTAINIDIVGKLSGEKLSETFDLPTIQSSRDVRFQYDIESDFLENDNTVSIIADKANLCKELYLFNNTVTRQLNIYEDTIPPHLEIAFDGEIIWDKEHISDQPVIEIKLTDNSKLPVTVPKPITVKWNGTLLDENNTQFYELNTFGRGDNLKAKLKIIPHKITENTNYFFFSGVDGSGNVKVENYYLYISLGNWIKDLFVSPNPATANDKFEFKYYLASSYTEIEAELEIYNAIGLKVITIYYPAKMRANIIPWDMRDANGYLIPPGTYYYRLNIISDIWTDPQFGKFVFVK